MVFLALDFETANGRRSSACSLGIVIFDERQTRLEWSTLINPQQEFLDFNIGIHGIRPEHVAAAPTTRQLAETLWPTLDGATLVCHSKFDVGVVNAVSKECGMKPPRSVWLDSCAIAQSLWDHLPNHKLKTVCKYLNFDFRHHDALEDARACSHIVRSALAHLAHSPDQLVQRFGRRG